MELEDDRAKRVIGFLGAKKLLIHNFTQLNENARFTVEEALWVAENVEPRVVEILPAALIHFPEYIDGKEAKPAKLKEMVEGLKRNEDQEEDFGDITDKNVKRWVSF